MGNGWFETVAEAERRAKRRLPRAVYKALLAGSEKGLTLNDNICAFDELGLAPHIVDLAQDRDQTTTVMGQEISLPVIISPTGVQAVHPQGELPVARAAANRGTAMGLSSFGSQPIEDVVQANPKTFFQSYWVGGREDMLVRVNRARDAGAVGVIVTLDWSFANGRDWGSPQIPNEMTLKTMAKYAPQIVFGAKFGYLWQFAKTMSPPQLTVPNMTLPDQKPPKFFNAYGQWMKTPQPSWDDIRWLREQWDGPFMVKGISRIDDARRAVDAGASAISVSNHGGNDLDGTPATIRVLPAVVDAVGDQVEVLMDGGIRRGSDVFKALALGAKAVMIGRAYLWGLAANGQAGVENVLDILRSGLDSGLMSARRRHSVDVTRADVVVPPNFGRSLGGEHGSHYGVSSLHEEIR